LPVILRIPLIIRNFTNESFISPYLLIEILRIIIMPIKADFQSSHEAPRSSLRVHAWALSSNHNAKQLILIRCKHSQRAARSFVRGLEIRLNSWIQQESAVNWWRKQEYILKTNNKTAWRCSSRYIVYNLTFSNCYLLTNIFFILFNFNAMPFNKMLCCVYNI
jgi:hypothetical protein